LFELATALIALGCAQFAAIQGDEERNREESALGEQMHQMVEEALLLFPAEFADVLGQTLGSE